MLQARVPDDLDVRIVRELQRDGRVSFNELARRLGVSTPTVSYRVKRLEDVGIIQGYTIRARLGRGTPEASKPAQWSCADCKAPIRGRARYRRLGDKFYAFCCGVCQESFLAKYARLSRAK